jgi:hypothetical protein
VGPAAPDRAPHVRVPPGAADLERWPWFPPFVRARHRRRLGLPATPIDVRGCAPSPVPRDDVPTALALAPAAVVDEEWLLVALALGTPCATTDEVAHSVLPEHGRKAVAIGCPDELDGLASSLAVGPDQARRSWAARVAASALDLTCLARRLGRSLGILGSRDRHHLDARLSELGTHAASLVAQRVRAAVGTLPRDDPEACA